jgi:peptidoglycan/LPS O-acetylase OafA/YrhL
MRRRDHKWADQSASTGLIKEKKNGLSDPPIVIAAQTASSGANLTRLEPRIAKSDTPAYPIGLCVGLIGFLNLQPKPNSVPGAIGTLLGDASYSIYLIHPLVFSWIYIALQPPLPPEWIQELIRYAALIVICAAAITSWMLFERPMTWLGNLIARLASRSLVKAVELHARVHAARIQ